MWKVQEWESSCPLGGRLIFNWQSTSSFPHPFCVPHHFTHHNKIFITFQTFSSGEKSARECIIINNIASFLIISQIPTEQFSARFVLPKRMPWPGGGRRRRRREWKIISDFDEALLAPQYRIIVYISDFFFYFPPYFRIMRVIAGLIIQDIGVVSDGSR